MLGSLTDSIVIETEDGFSQWLFFATVIANIDGKERRSILRQILLLLLLVKRERKKSRRQNSDELYTRFKFDLEQFVRVCSTKSVLREHKLFYFNSNQCPFSIFLFLSLRDKVEAIGRSVYNSYIADTTRVVEILKIKLVRNSTNLTRVRDTKRKQRDIIFSNRMQSNIIGRERYGIPSFRNEYANPRAATPCRVSGKPRSKPLPIFHTRRRADPNSFGLNYATPLSD